MKVYLATWLYEPAQGAALTICGNKNRLVSYFHTQDREEQLNQYVRTGNNILTEGKYHANRQKRIT